MDNYNFFHASYRIVIVYCLKFKCRYTVEVPQNKQKHMSTHIY
jgi:hypothetical protein